MWTPGYIVGLVCLVQAVEMLWMYFAVRKRVRNHPGKDNGKPFVLVHLTKAAFFLAIGIAAAIPTFEWVAIIAGGVSVYCAFAFRQLSADRLYDIITDSRSTTLSSQTVDDINDAVDG